MIVYFSGLSQAQDTSKILISKKDLTQEQIQRYESNKTVENISQWVGLGKEIGVAMNEGLNALTTNAVNFSETELGRFTMFIIAWKVLGKDAMRIFIALPAWLLIMGLFVWSYRRSCFPNKILKSKTDAGTIWGIFPRYNIEYETIEPKPDRGSGLGPNAVKGVHGVFAFIFTVAFLIAMFA